MDKSLIRGRIQTIKNNYALAQFAIGLIAIQDSRERIDEVLSLLDAHPKTQFARYIEYVFEDYDLLKLAVDQFRNSVLRNCMKEIFEQVKLFGAETNQEQIIRTAPWYQFLRVIRNCLSHDMKLKFRRYDMKKLPISWSGLTIDASMQNSQIPMSGFLSHSKAVELIDEVIVHIDTKCV